MNTLLTDRTFIPYRHHIPTSIRHRKLPHWQQEQTCVFVTFRLYDSLPQHLRDVYTHEKRMWLLRRGWPEDMQETDLLSRLSVREKRQFQRYGSSRYQRALDKGGGECHLIDPTNRKMFTNSLHHHAGHAYLLGDYVVMPNHVHVLVQPLPGEDVQKRLGGVRRYTARLINRRLHRTGAFWMPEPFDHLVRSRSYFRRYRQYIRLNPVRAGLKDGEYSLFQVED